MFKKYDECSGAKRMLDKNRAGVQLEVSASSKMDAVDVSAAFIPSEEWQEYLQIVAKITKKQEEITKHINDMQFLTFDAFKDSERSTVSNSDKKKTIEPLSSSDSDTVFTTKCMEAITSEQHRPMCISSEDESGVDEKNGQAEDFETLGNNITPRLNNEQSPSNDSLADAKFNNVDNVGNKTLQMYKLTGDVRKDKIVTKCITSADAKQTTVAGNVTKKDCSTTTNDFDEEEINKTVMSVYWPTFLKFAFRNNLTNKIPEEMKTRLIALKEIQLEHLQINREFEKELLELEQKYAKKNQQLFEKREKIYYGLKQIPVNIFAPKDDRKLKKEGEKLQKDMPGFWMTIFQKSKKLCHLVQQCDIPALEALSDIKIICPNTSTFTLAFHFAENAFFTNKVLTKQYFYKTIIDKDQPLNASKTVEIYKCEGCSIDWATSKNLGFKRERIMQKHTKADATRTIIIETKTNTFFDYFCTLQINTSIGSSQRALVQQAMVIDFKIGFHLYKNIIPNACLYYSGVLMDSDDEDEDNDA